MLVGAFHTIPWSTARSSNRFLAPQRLGQQWPKQLPLGIREFMATYHPNVIHHSRSCEDTA